MRTNIISLLPPNVKAVVWYYVRERYYRHAHVAAEDALQRQGANPVLLFWKAFAVVMEGEVWLGFLIAVFSSRDKQSIKAVS